MSVINNSVKYLILFVIGGTLYFLIEILWRQYSYFSMFILGGLCFTSVGVLKDHFFKDKGSLLMQQVLASLIITLLELIFGLVLNSTLGLSVWDYSEVKYNFMGQICLKYSILWFFLSLPTIILYDYLKYLLFNEKKPRYRYI